MNATAATTLPAVLPKLSIIHNHGVYELENVTLVPDPGKNRDGCFFARGTVIGGGQTSRLLWATSFRAEPVGVVKEYDIWNRRVHEAWNHPGEYRVDICTCG